MEPGKIRPRGALVWCNSVRPGSPRSGQVGVVLGGGRSSFFYFFLNAFSKPGTNCSDILGGEFGYLNILA